MADIQYAWASGRVALFQDQAVAQNGSVITPVQDVAALGCTGVLITVKLGCANATGGHWEIHVCARDGISIADIPPAGSDDGLGTPWFSASISGLSRDSVSGYVQRNIILPEPLPPSFAVVLTNKLDAAQTQYANLFYRTFSRQVV